MTTLRAAMPGDKLRVTKITGEGQVKHRIMNMGITRGSEITVRKVAPLGDPMEITVRGYELSLRKIDADGIEVERTPEAPRGGASRPEFCERDGHGNAD
jgi:ferrous iron transport protein A